jgi:hypothetical protein
MEPVLVVYIRSVNSAVPSPYTTQWMLLKPTS